MEKDRSLSSDSAELLAAELVEEMVRSWQQGKRVLPEALLAQYPELWAYPGAVAELIYEELCLRHEYGLETPVEEVLSRFPQWRSQLEVLIDCQRLLGPRRALPRFPVVGESLGDFLLLAELAGRANGRVFVASELSLGRRPVVLKLIPLEACEHLSLARLQHSHIVPVYSFQDYPELGFRSLCMPYFGGVTLAEVIETLQKTPPSRRTGQDLVKVLSRQTGRPAAFSADKKGDLAGFPTRQAMAKSSYVQALCWIGANLADALHYAHEHGLVHFDIKPSNVLLAEDGQPMVLDFHLARKPIEPKLDSVSGKKGPIQCEPEWIGGTPGYMSPEQQKAMSAIQRGQAPPHPIDGRSDIYSLGLVLYETLGGDTRECSGKFRPLNRCNAAVSVGLADLIAKCIAGNPADRYSSMSALAGDLRRQLANLPLIGVSNRSPVERLRKWRRRRPHGTAYAVMALAFLAAISVAASLSARIYINRVEQAQAYLKEGEQFLAKSEWDNAVGMFQKGLVSARTLPFQYMLDKELNRQLQQANQGLVGARRAQVVRDLHELMEQVRFFNGLSGQPPANVQKLKQMSRVLWEKRFFLLTRLEEKSEGPLDQSIQDDLLDLAILWAILEHPPASKNQDEEHLALVILKEAVELFGPIPVLLEERELHAKAPHSKKENSFAIQKSIPIKSQSSYDTAWNHCALSRTFLRAGNLERANVEAERAVHLEPYGLWPNFYQGLCAFRLQKYLEAAAAFSVCIGAAPKAAPFYYNRALVFDALGRSEAALAGYGQALHLDPKLAVAAMRRGLIHYRNKHLRAALSDLQLAKDLGADSDAIDFNLALVIDALKELNGAGLQSVQSGTQIRGVRDAKAAVMELK